MVNLRLHYEKKHAPEQHFYLYIPGPAWHQFYFTLCFISGDSFIHNKTQVNKLF